jgi:hypothetical protein
VANTTATNNALRMKASQAGMQNMLALTALATGQGGGGGGFNFWGS